MKTSIFTLFIFVTLNVTSQIMIFPSGLQSYGSTTSPANGEKHKFTGDVVISSSVSPSGSAIRLRGNNGYSTASTPDYTWLGNDQTGLFHPASDIIGFTVGGSEKFRMNSSGQLLNSNTTSSASTPDFSWNSDANTGFFRPANDVIGFVTGGTERARFSSNGNLLMGTTTESALVNVVVGNDGGIYTKSVYSADWQDPVIEAETNRSNSTTIKSTLSGTTTCYVSGAGWIYSQGMYLGSDRNIKDEINTIKNASKKIEKITGVTYKLKKEKQNPSLYGVANEYMGVIAQDVETVAPQAVKTLGDGTKAVSYEMLVGLLIEGFKEQAAKVTRLEAALNNCCSKSSESGTKPLSNLSALRNEDLSDGASYLKQNNPNPFNKETVIEYNIIESGTASILVFDMNGKLLKTLLVKIPGKGSITINANDFEPGMYYYTLIVNGKELDTKKMILTQ